MIRFLSVIMIWSIFSAQAEEIIKPTEHILQNGLKVLLIEDRNSPLVVCRLYYNVGSVNEMGGKSGLSHMLEHMMFKGTRKIGVKDTAASFALEGKIDSLFRLSDKIRESGNLALYDSIRAEARSIADSQRTFHKNNELWDLYQKEGGTFLNAWTGADMTAYIVTLPSNKLELFLWLESDRMSNPVMREFYTERDVVAEERRMRYEDSPYGRYYETLFASFYEAHPYRIPTIGYSSDIMQLTRDDAFNHFNQYYVPNNAFMVLIGDFNKDSVITKVKQYFSEIKPREINSIPITKEPEQIGEKRLKVKKDAGPLVTVLYKTPPISDSSIYALDLFSTILSGKSGRLWKTLVDKKRLCASVSAGFGLRRYGSYFYIQADLMESASHAEVEEIIFSEINRLTKEEVSERELQKVKNQAEADYINGLRSNERLADQLAWAENSAGSWRFLNTYRLKISETKSNDITTAISKWITEKNRTTGWLIREKGEEISK